MSDENNVWSMFADVSLRLVLVMLRIAVAIAEGFLAALQSVIQSF